MNISVIGTGYVGLPLAVEFGKKYNFDTVISLQPLAGFGNKSLTNQENEFSKTGLDYNDKLLINLLPIYDKYQENSLLIPIPNKPLHLIAQDEF